MLVVAPVIVAANGLTAELPVTVAVSLVRFDPVLVKDPTVKPYTPTPRFPEPESTGLVTPSVKLTVVGGVNKSL